MPNPTITTGDETVYPSTQNLSLTLENASIVIKPDQPKEIVETAKD